jgi:superfamily II DNA or RNA helicase
VTARRRRPTRTNAPAQDDLFSVDPTEHTMHSLDTVSWPPNEAFPFNRAGAHVGTMVRADLRASPEPLIVAGYSSIAELVDFLAGWEDVGHDGKVRFLLGTEPYPTTRFRFSSAAVTFTEEVHRYWEDQGISVRLSAKVLQAITAIDDGRLVTRFIDGAAKLHAKIYVGATAATVGSSNFTPSGLSLQLEANARFERDAEPERYDGLTTIAENLWAQGEPWDDELRALLHLLLQHVSWQEALARACAVLLEGEWAQQYLDTTTGVAEALWPSQRAGIAPALWIIETVGSVLVADATGSGKTRMGAHLVRAVRDRMWSTGRARRDLAVVVCPPPVQRTWRREATVCGVNLQTVSHGLLSRGSTHGRRDEEDAVNRAQILAVDESHNFLNPEAQRTKQVRESRADHVLLFTATPINRGPSDLLQLIGFLGADNFEDETLDILRRLDRRRSGDRSLSASEVNRLRHEIQQFTVRRTKTLLNELVDRDPDAYIHPDSGAVCRYPRHDASTYETGESPHDEAVAQELRAVALGVVGISQLERTITVPSALRHEYSDERWLAFRLTSVRGLAVHHVLSAMRSSRAALVEHLAGTSAARERFGLPNFKATDSGNLVAKLERLASEGPPEIRLDCDAPAWLTDPSEWRSECLAELERYRAMLAAAEELSDARERTKARLLAGLLERHERVLAFDRHPITLVQLRGAVALEEVDAEVIVATGSTTTEKKRVEDLFERTSDTRAIALCSDAMNEGLNLQGASAIVHLDLPTTLRVAEQRVGRVDRMDSPHESIEALWPRDGVAFATRANELLVQRAAESEELLGANLRVPDLRAIAEDDAVVDVEQRIEEAEKPDAEPWDGIRDAFEPARSLVAGPDALVPPALYDELRNLGRSRVMSAVASDEPWAFLAITAGSGQGAPRWLFLDGPRLRPIVGLDRVADHLRARLGADPPAVGLDEAGDHLDLVLVAAAQAEHMLLPRRMQRALDQLRWITEGYADAVRRLGDEETGRRWSDIASLADTSHLDRRPDPYAVAEGWLDLVRPRLDVARQRRRNQPFLLLKDIDNDLAESQLDLSEVESGLKRLVVMPPVDERVAACIIGVPVEAATVRQPVAARPGPSR